MPGFLSAFFANPFLLWGTLGASIPVIIHLLNRQRFKRVVWAAMHWLWASYRKSKRRLQIEQLILLLVRVLILLLLALALARPALQAGAAWLAGRPTVHRVIVLDNSYSMGQLANGRTLFDKAKDLAAEMASRMTLSDELDVLFSNSNQDEHAVSSALAQRNDVISQIKSAQLSDGGTDLPKSIAAACRLFNESKSKHPRKEILVITDQTRVAWERAHQPRRAEGEDEAAIRTAFAAPVRPRILMVRLPGENEPENVAAVSVEVDEKVVPANVETELIGTVECFAGQPRKDVRVKLKVDNEEVAVETVGLLTPDQPGTVTFRHVFAEPGSHPVAIELENDVLPADNTAFLAVDVEDRLRVLCVDGQQRVGPNAGEMDYFRQALMPEKSDEVRAGKMPLFPEVVSDSQFLEANLENYRLVVLGNVALIPTEKVQALVQYVKQGGSLLIFCGEQVDPAIYNRDLGELLPMALGELAGSDDPDGPKLALSDKDLEHPAIAKFKSLRGLPLSQLQTFRRFKLVPKRVVPLAEALTVAPQPVPQGDATVRNVLVYENGEPAAVEKTLGGGRVILFGTTADKDWNNWPTKNDYMPLMNFIALDLIRPAYLQRNRLVGERFSVQLPRQDVGAARRQGLRLVDPAGESSALDILTEQGLAESGPLRRAGVYSAAMPGETSARGRTLYFAANRNVEESDLATLDDRELLANIPREGDTATEHNGYFKNLVTQDDFELLPDDARAIEQSVTKRSGSREIWRWLAGAVLVLLLVESVLARRFGDYTRSAN